MDKSNLRLVEVKVSDLLGEIRNSFNSFHASECAIAQTILDNPSDITSMTISQLAEKSRTSVASVVRFSKAMGFKGFPGFKLGLVSQLSRQTVLETFDADVTIADSLAEIIKKISAADSLAIQSTAERLDEKTVKAVVDAWESARLIGTFGLASSAYVAMDLQLKLNRLGKPTVSWQDAHSALTSISLLTKGDVLVAVSHSGTTLDVVDVINEFRNRGVQIILITNSLRSPAVDAADLVLYTSARETTFRSGATASRIAQLTVVDCLCVALAQRNWSETKTALDVSRAAISFRSGKKMHDTNRVRVNQKKRGETK
jgi:DNA-binding MurR/RpiR family transcriptional regulator